MLVLVLVESLSLIANHRFLLPIASHFIVSLCQSSFASHTSGYFCTLCANLSSIVLASSVVLLAAHFVPSATLSIPVSASFCRCRVADFADLRGADNPLLIAHRRAAC